MFYRNFATKTQLGTPFTNMNSTLMAQVVAVGITFHSSPPKCAKGLQKKLMPRPMSRENTGANLRPSGFPTETRSHALLALTGLSWLKVSSWMASHSASPSPQASNWARGGGRVLEVTVSPLLPVTVPPALDRGQGRREMLLAMKQT